jgi:hypothetical protein
MRFHAAASQRIAGEDYGSWQTEAQQGPASTDFEEAVRGEGPQATWIRRVLPAIESLSELPPDWDSYGAARIDRSSINAAAELARVVSFLRELPAPSVGATPAGEVQLVWRGMNRVMEVVAHTNGRYAWVLVHRDHPEEDRAQQAEEATQLRSVFSTLLA